MPRLTIVIPALGSIEALEITLVSVLEHRPSDCEILVALTQPYKDPYGLQGEVRFVRCPRGTSAVGCINDAVSLAKAPFVHILAAGCEATEGWTDVALERFGDRRLAAVTPLAIDAQNHERIFAAGAGLLASGRRVLIGRGQSQLGPEELAKVIGPASFAAFYRKAAWDLVGGFAAGLVPAGADIDFARSLTSAGLTIAFEKQATIFATCEAEVHQGAFREGLAAERLFWRNLPSEGRGRAITRHALAVSAEMIQGLVRPSMATRVIARALALCEVGSYVRRGRRLAEWSSHSTELKRATSQLRVDGRHAGPVRDGANGRIRSR